MIGKPFRSALTSGSGLMLTCMLLAACVTGGKQDDGPPDLRVVAEQKSALYERKPKPSDFPLVYLPQGTQVEVIRERLPYVEVRLPNGQEGWMVSPSLHSVLPEPPAMGEGPEPGLYGPSAGSEGEATPSDAQPSASVQPASTEPDNAYVNPVP